MGKASRLRSELRARARANTEGQAQGMVASSPETEMPQQIITRTRQTQYLGPTPPPEHLQVYEQMVPGAAARFLVLAEGEAVHRRGVENAQVDWFRDRDRAFIHLAVRGQIFAFVIAMSGIGGGVWLSLHSAQVSGAIIGGGGLVTIILAFLRGGGQPPNPPPST